MKKNKGFTILELLVVVAIIAILAVIAIPNFIGKIEDAKASQELAEINAVEKAIATYYADNGVYPTLQAKDGTLLQPQPIDGSPHNIDFSSLVPDYLATLPHFSYWWVDYQGKIYHTQHPIGSVSGDTFTPTNGYTYTVYKTNGAMQAVTAGYVLLAGEYILGVGDNGIALPKITSSFKNTKVHPESGEVSNTPVIPSVYTFTTAGATGKSGPTQSQLDTAYTATSLAGYVTSSSGAQLWTVPTTGTYRVEVYGSAGGGPVPGKGAIMKGDLTLTAGQQLRIVVGQKGIAATGYLAGNYSGGGGGGGSYLVAVSGTTPLIIAGGGGGGGTYDLKAGLDANTATSGVSTYQNGGGTGGSGGQSGITNGDASGGGGFNTNGQNSSSASTVPSLGGYSYKNGSLGGQGDVQAYPRFGGDGGFGGGGGGWNNNGARSGGGGGYSGGQGGNPSGIASGGGGGSYNSGTNQANTVGNTGDGKVIITYVGP